MLHVLAYVVMLVMAAVALRSGLIVESMHQRWRGPLTTACHMLPTKPNASFAKDSDTMKVKFNRPLEAVLAWPGNHAEQAFARGYKTVSKGVCEDPSYSRRSHVNHKHYLAGKRQARQDAKVPRDDGPKTRKP